MVPSGVSGKVLDTSEKESGKVHQANQGFVEIGIKISNIEDARIGESCTFDKGFRTGDGGVYSGFPQSYLDINTDSIVVANHHGIQTASSENTFIDGYIPINAPSRGGGAFARGNLNWSPQLEITGKSVELSVNSHTVRVPANASKTESFEVSGEYTSKGGKQKSIETTAEISVSHHGKRPFYIHDNQMLIPKASEMGQFIDETVPGLENTKQIEVRPDLAGTEARGQQVIKVSNQSEVRSLPAYGMRVDAVESGGEN